MIIGIPKEIKNNEYRVAIMPSGVKELIMAGHHVIIQKDAGIGSMLTDLEYIRYGAIIKNTPEAVYSEADIILKVKEPVKSEYELLKKGQIIFAFLHLAANKDMADVLIKKNITALSYDTVEDKDGTLPILKPMSEIAGKGLNVYNGEVVNKDVSHSLNLS